MHFSRNCIGVFCTVFAFLFTPVVIAADEIERLPAGSSPPRVEFKKNYRLGLSFLTALRYTSTNGEVSQKKSQLRHVRFMQTFDFSQDNWQCKANYRFYPAFNGVRDAYCQHRWNNDVSVAFGILPTLLGTPGYHGESFWGTLPFYYGLQGDRDVGSVLTVSRKHWDLELGYFFSDEYGDGGRADRTTIDSVNSPLSTEKESGAVSARWTLHASNGKLHLSAQRQRTVRNEGKPARRRLSYAIDHHLKISNWRIESTLGYSRFDNRSGIDIGAPHVGGFGGSFEIAPRSHYAVLRLTRAFGASGAAEFSCHAELSMNKSKSDGFRDGRLAILGCTRSSDAYTLYVDLVRARNVVAVSTFGRDFLRTNSQSTELQVVLNVKIF